MKDKESKSEFSKDYKHTLLTKELNEASQMLQKQLPKDTFYTLPDNRIVTIPISGVFKSELSMLQEYLMELMFDNPDDLIKTMALINSDPAELDEAIKEGKLEPRDNKFFALRTIIVLNQEIQYQAITQGAALVYDKKELYDEISGQLKDEISLNDNHLSKEELEKRIKEEKDEESNSSGPIIIEPNVD
jgi:hypothetical protein